MTLGNYTFYGPYDPNGTFTTDFGAVYAIIDDTPKVLDVGQTSSVNSRIPFHDRKECWDRNKTGMAHLYVFVNSSEQDRVQIEQSIRRLYNPVCGIQ